jgi:hypothetical protein
MLGTHPLPSGSYPHVSTEWDVEFNPSIPSSTFDASLASYYTSSSQPQLVLPNGKVTRVYHKKEPLDLSRIYRLSVTTFMASGGDNVNGFVKNGRIISKDEFKVADLVLKYLRFVKLLHPNLLPRLRPLVHKPN